MTHRVIQLNYLVCWNFSHSCWQISYRSWTSHVWQHTPTDPHYLNNPNYSWPSVRFVVSLISGQGYFTFLYGYTKHNIHNPEWGGRENKQTRTWVSSKHKKGEDCDTFVQLFVHLQAIMNLYSSEISTKPQRTLTHPLTLANPDLSPQVLVPALFCRLPCSVYFSALSASPDFCRLPCSLPWYLLCSASFSWLWDITSLFLFRSRGKSHAKALCVGLTPKQTRESSDWYSPAPTEMNANHRITHGFLVKTFFSRTSHNGSIIVRSGLYDGPLLPADSCHFLLKPFW